MRVIHDGSVASSSVTRLARLSGWSRFFWSGVRSAVLLPSLLLVLLLSASGTGLTAATAGPVAANLMAADGEVDRALAQLSLDQKIGLMILPRVRGELLQPDSSELGQLLELARLGRIGGAVFFAGDALSTTNSIAKLREAASLPLLFAIDAETGVGMRLAGTQILPTAMALGAAGDLTLAYSVGAATARDAGALGLDLLLAPVVDLALEPQNTVIGVRSFGADPQAVGRLAAAWVRGAQDEGALAVVKHFPGHGATREDSHQGLAVLDVSPARLRERELVPFAAAIEAGVAGVMPGHLSVPQVEESTVPASRSAALLQGWLRDELGFAGLIVSDALEMKGFREAPGETTAEALWDGSAAVRAVIAGVDLLLVPPDPRVTWRALHDAVKRGELTQQRIDQSARKILAASLRRTELPVDLNGAVDRLAAATFRTPEGRGSKDAVSATGGEAAAMSNAGLTLVEDPAAVVPNRTRSISRWLVLEWMEDVDRSSVPVLVPGLARRADEVRRVRLTPKTFVGERGAVAEMLVDRRCADVANEETGDAKAFGGSAVDGVLFAHFGRSLRIEDPRTSANESVVAARQLCADLEVFANSGHPVVFAALRTPETLQPFQVRSTNASPATASFPGAAAGASVIAASSAGDAPWESLPCAPSAARLATFDPSPRAQNALVAALYGETRVNGHLPSPVALWPLGQGLERSAFGAIQEVGAIKEAVAGGARWQSVREVLRSAVDSRVTPGLVALVARSGKVLFHEAFGTLTYEPGSPAVTRDTLYDLASLTKVVATTTLAMLLVDRGALDLEAPVSLYVPEFQGEGKERITVADLLAHSSGILWWTDLWARYGSRQGEPSEEARRGYLHEIFELPLHSPPRTETVYSDLGILLLGEIIERVSGRPLDELARREIFEPLGMVETLFRPDLLKRSRIAPTEIDASWRGGLVWGQVHDENAFGLGGVAAHAGLFSTAGDLAKFTQMLVNGGHLNGQRLLRQSTIERFIHPANLVEGSSRGLGWDTASVPSSSGCCFGAHAFGHTGFTGTSIWIDPERELVAILLTNRVHPTRENIGIRTLRPAFHDAVITAIGAP